MSELEKKIEKLGRGVLGPDYVLCADQEEVIDRVIERFRRLGAFAEEVSGKWKW